jgi:NAD(P)-dependent dehydrogenase (short-subunit alcohol dehydrogenase family)
MYFNPFSLEGKTVLVTGAGSGIGRAISVSASKLGAVVLMVDINEEGMKATMTMLDGQEYTHRYYVLDLTDKESLNVLVESLDGIDGLVNCAGISNTRPLQMIREEDFDRVVGINTKAPILFTNLLYKKMKLNKGASLVFVSSLAGLYTFTPANGLYSLSKSALTSYAKSCAVEFAIRGIRSNCVNPSMVNTHLKENLALSEEDYRKEIQKYPLRRFAEPEEVANAVVFLLSDGSSYITGHTLLVDGGRALK